MYSASLQPSHDARHADLHNTVLYACLPTTPPAVLHSFNPDDKGSGSLPLTGSIPTPHLLQKSGVNKIFCDASKLTSQSSQCSANWRRCSDTLIHRQSLVTQGKGQGNGVSFFSIGQRLAKQCETNPTVRLMMYELNIPANFP